MENKNRQMIIGFNVDSYNKNILDELNDHAKYELYLTDNTAVLYETVSDFFSELNANLVDTENMFWYIINF